MARGATVIDCWPVGCSPWLQPCGPSPGVSRRGEHVQRPLVPHKLQLLPAAHEDAAAECYRVAAAGGWRGYGGLGGRGIEHAFGRAQPHVPASPQAHAKQPLAPALT